jgi:two-component system LytT family response regulator
MITAVLIDDEHDAIDVLSELLKTFVQKPVKVVGTANGLDEGIKIINATRPDIVFLDIDMPNKSGMEIYNYFKNPEFKIIFVTAYKQFAIEAIKNSATDYLLKPVNFWDLNECLTKVGLLLDQEQIQRELEDKINILCSAEMDGKNLVFETETGFVMENTKNIEYCYAEQSSCVLVSYLGKKITISKSLKDLQALLPNNQFYRTHKSYLVNIHYIRKFVRANESHLLLKSGMKIPVSVRNRVDITKEIKQMLTN